MLNDCQRAEGRRLCCFQLMKQEKQSGGLAAESKVPCSARQRPPIDIKLHMRLVLEGSAQASTFESAMEALLRIRQRREAEHRFSGQ